MGQLNDKHIQGKEFLHMGSIAVVWNIQKRSTSPFGPEVGTGKKINNICMPDPAVIATHTLHPDSFWNTEHLSAYSLQFALKYVLLSHLLLLLSSHSVVSDSSQPHGLQPVKILWLWDFSGRNVAVGCHFFLQGIFLTQGLNPRLLLHLLLCRQILYHCTI